MSAKNEILVSYFLSGGIMEIKSNYKKKVTMRDVAEIANVSVSTVSRVINEPESVDISKRESVEQALAISGYIVKIDRAKTTASKAKRFKGNIALMVPDIANPHFQEFIFLIERQLIAIGYMMTLCIFENKDEIIDKYFKDLISRNFDGCIMCCLRPSEESIWARRFVELVPIVSIQSDIDGVDSINTTDKEGTFEIVEHLVSMGHQRIAFIGYSWNLSLFERRLNAYKEVHIKHGLPIRDEYIGYCEANLKSGYEEACKILSLSPRPTAIHSFNTYTAMGVYMAIRDNKLSIPKDISISAMDETPITHMFTPSLSVVSQPIELMAKTGVEMLIDRLENGKKFPPKNVIFPTTLLLRKSIGFCTESD